MYGWGVGPCGEAFPYKTLLNASLPPGFSITRAAIDFSVEEIPTYYYFSVSAGRPPFGQMPFIVTPEGKTLAQSGTIMKYICKKGGDVLNVAYRSCRSLGTSSPFLVGSEASCESLHERAVHPSRSCLLSRAVSRDSSRLPQKESWLAGYSWPRLLALSTG